MADDAELQLFRSSVNCAAVLEGMVGGWRLDVRESTRRALKYRRAKGEILIITHDGRGWWDPLSKAKGDIFDLVQYLDGGLNFGQVRQVLRRFVGFAPTYPTAIRTKQGRGPSRPPQERWAKRPCLRSGSPAWAYLAGVRCLPVEILTAATAQDAVREGYYGSAWFAHRADGTVSHIEVRGPDYRAHSPADIRRCLCSARPATACAVSPLPRGRSTRSASPRSKAAAATPSTLRPVAGWGPAPSAPCWRCWPGSPPSRMRSSRAPPTRIRPGTVTRDVMPNWLADACVRFERLRPPEGLDFNDVLKQRRGT
jgi:hypothetical protein